MSYVKTLFRSPALFSFVDCSTLLSLGWFLSLLAPFHGRYPTTLHLQYFRVSKAIRASQLHTVASLGHHPGTLLTHIWPPMAFLSHGRRFHKPFLLFLTLETAVWFWSSSSAAAVAGSLLLTLLRLHQPSALPGFLHRLSWAVLKLMLWIRLSMN